MHHLIRRIRLTTSLYNSRISIYSKKLKSSWTYECSVFAEPHNETILLEKSIRHGCKSIITQSNATSHIYEVVQDIHLTDDIKLSEFQLGHRLRLSPQLDITNNSDLEVLVKGWKAEIASIKSFIQPYSLSYITLPYEIISLTGAHSEIINRLLTDTTNIHTNVKLGLDFPSSLLSSAVEEDIEGYINTLHDLNSSSDRRFTLSVVTVALNCKTFTNAHRLISFAKASNLLTIATEVLRIHPKRAGLFTYSTRVIGSGNSSAALLNDSKQSDILLAKLNPQDTSVAISEENSSDNPVAYYNRVMKTCVGLEKQYLHKVCMCVYILLYLPYIVRLICTVYHMYVSIKSSI